MMGVGPEAAGTRELVGSTGARLTEPRPNIAAALSAGGIAIPALFLLLFPHQIVDLFPATAPVHAVAAAMLPVWAPFILFDGLQVVFVYALRSLGDQVAAGVNSILAFFVITGGAGFALVALGWGPFALVYASGIGMVASAAFNGGRLYLINRRIRSQS